MPQTMAPKGTKAFPTQILQDLTNKGKKIDIVFAVVQYR